MLVQERLWSNIRSEFLPHDENGEANKGNESASDAYHGKHPVVDLTVI